MAHEDRAEVAAAAAVAEAEGVVPGLELGLSEPGAGAGLEGDVHAFLVGVGGAPAQVYIAVGKEGRVMERDAKRLATMVRKSPRIRVGFNFLKEYDHANILHRAMLDGVRWSGEKQ